MRKSTVLRRIDWIVDGYVLGEYDIYECAARMSRTVAAHLKAEMSDAEVTS